MAFFKGMKSSEHGSWSLDLSFAQNRFSSMTTRRPGLGSAEGQAR